MIGAKELLRYVNETMVVGGGDLDRQLTAWGIDAEEFKHFAATWCLEVASIHNVHPQVVNVSFFAGFELGYRACAEAGMLSAEVPDVVPDDPDFVEGTDGGD